MPIIENLRYRPDIDGLRAIAVLAVVFYHADFRLPGGFVGVDVFFVISGFLITSIIWKDLESGKFTFAQFWERRARRIVPPLVVVTLAALIIGVLVLLPADLISLGRAAASQSLFAANFNYWQELNYFAGSAKEKPLLHTWSLAVEEQFYLFVPFLLALIFRFKFARARVAVLSVLITIFIISFALSVYSVRNSPSAAFYLLHSRAWELLTGSILAFLPIWKIRRSFREIISLSGLMLIVAPILIYRTSMSFPGITALPPCLGTALIIWANNEQTSVGKILSSRPFVFVGLISYSLYLWHWIFFSFGRYLALEPSALAFHTRIFLVALSFILAWLSWQYVETPFRRKKIAATRRAAFAFAGAGLAAVLIFGSAFFLLNGLPQRFSDEDLAYTKGGMPFAYNTQIDDIKSDNLTTIGKPEVAPTMLIWGDSHAMAAMPAFDALLKEREIGGRAATYSATAPVLDWYVTAEVGLGKNAVAFGDNIISYIQRNKVKDVVLVSQWSGYLIQKGFRPALLNTIKKIRESNARVWVLLTVPMPGFNVPRGLVYHYSDEYLARIRPKQNEFGQDFLDEIKNAGATPIDPTPVFKNQNGYYLIEKNGTGLYIDGDHLSEDGAKIMLLPLLIESFPTE